MHRGLVAGGVLAAYFALAGAADARTINWSGYTWDIRNQGLSEPGPNYWSDSTNNVSVDGTTLVVSIGRAGSLSRPSASNAVTV